MLKNLEELVTESRLDQIAREHKSIGAILDKRHVFSLDEIPRRSQRDDSKLNARRGGKVDSEISYAAISALESFKEKGINMNLYTGNYEMEEKLWKEKLNKPSYCEQRKYKYPHLETLFISFTPKQMADYKEKTGEALVNFVESCRTKCREIKSEMDMKGIFHPEANAHRVHCMYLLMLNKGICCDNIENVVLKSMLPEQINIDSKINIGETINDSPTSKEMKKSIRCKGQTQQFVSKATDSAERKVIRYFDSSAPKLLRKSQTTIELNPIRGHHHTTINFKNLEKKSTIIPNSEEKKDNAKSYNIIKQQKVDIEEEGLLSKSGLSPLKLFSKKLKHEKMGYMDSRAVLPEEARRLDFAEEEEIKKERDKSNLLEDKLSLWMLKEIQSKEVNKTGIGAMASPSLKTNTRNQPLAFAINDDVLRFGNSPKRDGFANNTSANNFSPQKVVPFEEFYALLQSHSESNIKASESKFNVSREILGLQSPNGGANHNSYHPVVSLDQDTSSANTALSMIETQQESANLLKHLSDKDKRFESYLKVSENEQLSSKLLSKLSTNSNLMKSKKVRRVAPLGKDAMNLTDSRGRTSKHAKKGFVNVFMVDPNADGGVNGIINSPPKELTTKNVLERLQSDDGYQHNNVALEVKDKTVGSNPPKSPDNVGRQSTKWRSLSRSSSRPKSKQNEAESDSQRNSRDIEVYGPMHDDISQVPCGMECDVQNKLLIIWEILRIPAQIRLSFMAKYSSQVYAAEMGHAVDTWGAAAVLSILLLETLLVLKKMQEGLLVFPLSCKEILKFIVGKVHPLLSSTSTSLVSPTILYFDKNAIPYSATVLAKMRSQIKNRISTYYEISWRNNYQQPPSDLDIIPSAVEGIHIINNIVADIHSELLEVLKCAQQELDDVIYFGEKTCREWAASLGYYEQHP